MRSQTKQAWLALAVVLGLALVFTAVLAQTSPTYDLSWSSLDGGGGVSSGEGYSLTGSLAQPDAGILTGGDYTLDGGFLLGGQTAASGPPITYLPVILRR